MTSKEAQVQPAEQGFWRIDENFASLHAPELTGKISLACPADGIHSLSVGGMTVDGFVLGMTTEQSSPDEPLSKLDTLVRSESLIASLPQNDSLPFSWQIRWQVDHAASSTILVDAVVSLETRLLESYPQVALTSQLAADEVWFIGPEGEARCIEPENGQKPVSRAASVLIRLAGTHWSFAEMTPPEDRGAWSVTFRKGICDTQQLAGGEFLEKGVIRRLRVRGAFLPREDDLAQAALLLQSFANEEPPLASY